MGRPIHTRIGGRLSLAGEQMRMMCNIDAATGVEPCTVTKQTGSKRFNVESVAGPGSRTGTVTLVTNDLPSLNEGYLRVLPTGVDEGGGLVTTTTLRGITGATAIVVRGAGYVIADTLTVVGGTSSEVAIYDVNDLSTVADQDETDFDNSPTAEGTFVQGTGYTALDVITMSDGSTVRVDVAGSTTIDEFTILTASTAGVVGNDQTLTQASVAPTGGTGFQLVLGTSNQGVFDATISATDGNYSVELGVLGGSFTVNETAIRQPALTKETSWWLIAGSIGAYAIFIIFVIWLAKRRSQ